LLGHAGIKTTSRYAHISRERLMEAVEFVAHNKNGAMLPIGAQAYDQLAVMATVATELLTLPSFTIRLAT